MSRDTAELAETCRTLFRLQIAVRQGRAVSASRLAAFEARGLALLEHIDSPDLSVLACALTPSLLEALPDQDPHHRLFADDFALIADHWRPEDLLLAQRKGIVLRPLVRGILARPVLDDVLPALASEAALTTEISDFSVSLLNSSNPRGIARILEVQVAAFSSQMLQAAETFLARNHLEGVVALILAGLDPNEGRLDDFATKDFEALRDSLCSAHGRLKLRETTGSLPDFLADKAARTAALRARLTGR